MNNYFTTSILKWYECNGRDLPWRHTKDPYKIWISEIILQQTRIAQGYDYYVRFIEQFPDVKTLANSPIDMVLKYWQGLGYYSRARNLHAASKQILSRGTFPVDYEDVLALKGIGEYTAAAIVSFAYGQPRAVLDGNVYRVLARYFNIHTPIDSTEGKKTFQTLAQEMLYPKDPAKYNQAVMDFGAIQCTPKGIDCAKCPLMDTCLSFAEGTSTKLPVKAHTTKVRDRFLTYVYIRHNGETLLRKRGGRDIWKGLYELPLLESDKELTVNDLEEVSWIRYPLTLVSKDIKHQLSHQLLHVNLYLMECSSRPDIEGVWVQESDREKFPVSKLMSNIFNLCDACV